MGSSEIAASFVKFPRESLCFLVLYDIIWTSNQQWWTGTQRSKGSNFWFALVLISWPCQISNSDLLTNTSERKKNSTFCKAHINHCMVNSICVQSLSKAHYSQWDWLPVSEDRTAVWEKGRRSKATKKGFADMMGEAHSLNLHLFNK